MHNLYITYHNGFTAIGAGICLITFGVDVCHKSATFACIVRPRFDFNTESSFPLVQASSVLEVLCAASGQIALIDIPKSLY